MSKMSQKEAVYNAVTQVLSSNNITISGGVAPHMTREFRSQVNEILFNSFRSGNVELKSEYSDAELRAYVSGLQSNWIRKDTRLNGNNTQTI